MYESVNIIGFPWKLGNFYLLAYVLHLIVTRPHLSFSLVIFGFLACDYQGCFAPIAGVTTDDAIHQWSFLSWLYVIAKAVTISHHLMPSQNTCHAHCQLLSPVTSLPSLVAIIHNLFPSPLQDPQLPSPLPTLQLWSSSTSPITFVRHRCSPVNFDCHHCPLPSPITVAGRCEF